MALPQQVHWLVLNIYDIYEQEYPHHIGLCRNVYDFQVCGIPFFEVEKNRVKSKRIVVNTLITIAIEVTTGLFSGFSNNSRKFFHNSSPIFLITQAKFSS